MFRFFFFPKIQMKLCLFFRASSSTSEPDGGEHPSGGEQRVRLCVWQGLYQRHDDVCRVTGGQERPLSCNVFCQFCLIRCVTLSSETEQTLVNPEGFLSVSRGTLALLWCSSSTGSGSRLELQFSVSGAVRRIFLPSIYEFQSI